MSSALVVVDGLKEEWTEGGIGTCVNVTQILTLEARMILGSVSWGYRAVLLDDQEWRNDARDQTWQWRAEAKSFDRRRTYPWMRSKGVTKV